MKFGLKNSYIFFWETRNECSWPLSVLSVFRFMLSTVTSFVKYHPELFLSISVRSGYMKKECGIKLFNCNEQCFAFIIDS